MKTIGRIRRVIIGHEKNHSHPRWWTPSRLYGVLRIGTPLPHAPLFLYSKDWCLILFLVISYTCVLVRLAFLVFRVGFCGLPSRPTDIHSYAYVSAVHRKSQHHAHTTTNSTAILLLSPFHPPQPPHPQSSSPPLLLSMSPMIQMQEDPFCFSSKSSRTFAYPPNSMSSTDHPSSWS